MTLYRLAVKRVDSDSPMGTRSGSVIAAFPINFSFGRDGERSYLGLVTDLPDNHPLVTEIGKTVPARDGRKHRFAVDWGRAGISVDTLAIIRDLNKEANSRIGKIAQASVLIDRDNL